MAESDSGSIVKDLSAGLSSIFQRIGDFFDIFDLSFFVSGATTLGAFAFFAWRNSVRDPLPQGWVHAAGLVIGSYVLGLLCFAIGRYSRIGKQEENAVFDDRIRRTLGGHGLENESPFKEYLARIAERRGVWRLYVRLWAEVRQSAEMSTSFSLLRRYWVMAATYDGMVVALVVWAVVLALAALPKITSNPISPIVAAIAAGLLILCALACRREAQRYVEYQVEEIIASIATKH